MTTIADLTTPGAFYAANIPQLAGTVLPIVLAGETEAGALWIWWGSDNHIIFTQGGNFAFDEDSRQGVLTSEEGEALAYIATVDDSPEVRDTGQMIQAINAARAEATGQAWDGWLAEQLTSHANSAAA